jgi:hypothetical protein
MEDDYKDDEEIEDLFTEEEMIQLRQDQGPPENYPKYDIEGTLICRN